MVTSSRMIPNLQLFLVLFGVLVPFRLADPRASVYDADSSLSAAIDAEPIEVAPAVVDGATDDEGHGEGQIDAKASPAIISSKRAKFARPVSANSIGFIRTFSARRSGRPAETERRRTEAAEDTENGDEYEDDGGVVVMAADDEKRFLEADPTSSVGHTPGTITSSSSLSTSFVPSLPSSSSTTASSSTSSGITFPEGDDLPVPDPPQKSGRALSELDLKSDRELAKLMRRTTVRMRDYPATTGMPATSATTTISPLLAAAQLAASQAPSLFPGILQGLSYPPPAQPLPVAAATTHSPVRRQTQRAEQFEQLGCGWDLLTLSCKDVFRVGWCASCVDFGNALYHDCRCTAVTGLYVQTSSFLGSSAASAVPLRIANAAALNQSAIGSTTIGPALPGLPSLPLLPTLAQLAAPLAANDEGQNVPHSSPSPLLGIQQNGLFGIGPQQQSQRRVVPIQAQQGVALFAPPVAAAGGPIALPQLGDPFGRR